MAFFSNASEIFIKEKSVLDLYIDKQLVWSKNHKKYEELLYIEATVGQFIGDFNSGKFFPTEDTIPVLDHNGVPCLYDTTKKIFLYNQGTGKFSYARKLEWIEDLETGVIYKQNGNIVPCRLSSGMTGLFNIETKEFTPITNKCLCSDFFVLNYSVLSDSNLNVQEIKQTSNKSLIYMYPLKEGYTYTISSTNLNYKISDFFIFDEYNFAEGTFKQIDSVANGNTNIANYTPSKDCYLCCTINKTEASTLEYDEFVEHYTITKQVACTVIPAGRYIDTDLVISKEDISKIELTFALAELPVNVENRLQYFVPIGACEGASDNPIAATYNNRFCVMWNQGDINPGFRFDIFSGYETSKNYIVKDNGFNTKKHTVVVDVLNETATIDGALSTIAPAIGNNSVATLCLNKCNYFEDGNQNSQISGWTIMNFYSLRIYNKDGNLFKQYLPYGKSQIKETISGEVKVLKY